MPKADPLDTSSVALRLRGVGKDFLGFAALRDVDLDVRPGEVRALVGENGAGKSTLMKIVAGALKASAGTVEIGGVELTQAKPEYAAACGVAVIYQDRQIGADLSVCENVLLGRLPRRFRGLVDWKEAYRRTSQLLERVGLETDPRRPARELSIAEHQSLEIARALNGSARVVIMDEPTAALDVRETRRLFEVIRALKAEGQAVVYVSHHLEEIFEVSDTVTVLRDGMVVGSCPTADVDTQQLTKMMFGRDVRSLRPRSAELDHVSGKVLLSAQDLHAAPSLRGVSLEARAGEILCITGGIGSGRRELARCLAGVQRPERGTVRVASSDVAIGSRRQAIRHGMGFVPDDRRREGVLLPLDLVENIDLTRLAVGKERLARPARRRRRASRMVAELHIRHRSLDKPVQELSGGNQQKVLLGRLLNVDAKVLILDEPTAGVDVETKLEVYELLRTLVDRGACVVAFSSDFEEIRVLADRVLVMRKGVVVDELKSANLSGDRLLALGSRGG